MAETPKSSSRSAWLSKFWKGSNAAPTENTSTAAESTQLARILVVEDDAHIAAGIKLNLEAEGYEAEIAGDGPTALQMIHDAPADTPFELVILDLMLPGMSGYAVCESLRNQGWDRPIVMLSARTLTEDRIRGFDVGADLYLQKPFDLEELLSVVRGLLQRYQTRSAVAATTSAASTTPATGTSSADPWYRFGDAEVNFDTFEVRVAGKPVRLTTLEIKLLRYFVEHERVVVTRAQLLEHVWGLSHTPTTRTVDNFMMNLRKTFERDSTQPRHFLSVRGAGYRFVAQPSVELQTGDETEHNAEDELPIPADE